MSNRKSVLLGILGFAIFLIPEYATVLSDDPVLAALILLGAILSGASAYLSV